MADSVVEGYGDGGGLRLGFIVGGGGVCDRYGDDFAGEEVGFLGIGGAGVGLCAESVLVGAGDVVVRCYVLRRHAHGHDAVSCFFDGGGFQVGPEVDGDGAGGVVAGHGFRAGAYADVDAADGDGVGDCGDGLQGGGAGSVDGVEGCAGGVADVVEGHAGGFAATELGEDGPDCYILDDGGGNVGILV